ncbi:hypothetical protein [Rhizobium leucaenae]|uniref:hypothetical protein n=1 Tax=Rhizobium leucaenae TaxID=29450 RepID=UPI001614128C|nr:hypothetical protein [Rhizobium leucaenae]MBB6305082.1 hypothetical protein [Rhizobium leucaenae]
MISLIAFVISMTSFYLSTLRKVDDLRVASSPPGIATNDIVGASFSPMLRIGQKEGVDITLTTPKVTLGDSIGIGKDFTFAYINSGSRDAVVLDGKLIVMQRENDDFPAYGPQKCEDGYPGEWSFNLLNVGATLEPGRVKAVQPTFNEKDLLYSGSTVADSLDEQGNLKIPIRKASLDKGRFFVRVCARFIVASANSQEAVAERDVIFYDTDFSLTDGQWKMNFDKFGKGWKGATRPQVLLQGSDDLLSRLLLVPAPSPQEPQS